MKLNAAERLLVNNSVRAMVQRFYEGPLLRRLGGAVEGGRVLDVGCGRGVGVEILFRQFGAADVTAIDLDPDQVARAASRLGSRYNGQLHLEVASVEDLPFADANFDAVFDFGMLHHVPAWQLGIAEISRVLKPQGTFFFEEITRVALERWAYRTFLHHPADNRFSEGEFVAELSRRGLLLAGPCHRVLFGDIFIGAARRG